ncbi:hypothetical protein [Candidatus Neptunochlamydia vexilliferae]|nr:hypothetical protein [Candidatus Neptunochlamydia vexilliferae]
MMSLSAINTITDGLSHYLAQPTKLDQLRKLSFQSSSSNSYYQDAYTQAATKFYGSKKVEQLDLNRGWFEKRPRLVFEDSKLRISEGYSLPQIIYLFFFNFGKLKNWYNQNQSTIQEYKKFLESECGADKVKQIEKTYGFSLDEMIKTSTPLEPRHVYFFNIGMNNIEDKDTSNLYKRIKDNEPLTGREKRAVEKLEINLEAIKTQTYEESFATLMQILETPSEDWGRLYTGREFGKVIGGSYNKDIEDRDTFRPWVDQQELLQVYQLLKNPFSRGNVDQSTPEGRQTLDRFFFEMLTKVVVKKHLMRKGSDGTWRVGAIIPSPYKDKKGNTIYYRVEQGVDSGFGKFWYVFRPISDDPTILVIRAPRDTSKDGYAQRGRPTLTRDASATPGELYSDTTKVEDKKFFSEFTLPLPLAYLAAHLQNGEGEKSFDKVHARLLEKVDNNTKIWLEGAYSQFREGEAYFHFYLELLKGYYGKDDWERFEDLLAGKKPRPLASIGNSLGGYDAAHDAVTYTAKENRIFISDFTVYTHSPLKVSEKDDTIFATFIKDNIELMDNLDINLTLDHIAEIADIVPLYPAGTFLGRHLQEDFKKTPEKLQSRVKIDFRIVQRLKSGHPQLRAKPHLTRFENTTLGTDYSVLNHYKKISAFDEFGKKKTIMGITLDNWHKWITSSSKPAKLTKSLWNRGAHVPHEFKDHKLVVSLKPNGSSEHKFISQTT